MSSCLSKGYFYLTQKSNWQIFFPVFLSLLFLVRCMKSFQLLSHVWYTAFLSPLLKFSLQFSLFDYNAPLNAFLRVYCVQIAGFLDSVYLSIFHRICKVSSHVLCTIPFHDVMYNFAIGPAHFFPISCLFRLWTFLWISSELPASSMAMLFGFPQWNLFSFILFSVPNFPFSSFFLLVSYALHSLCMLFLTSGNMVIIAASWTHCIFLPFESF